MKLKNMIIWIILFLLVMMIIYDGKDEQGYDIGITFQKEDCSVLNKLDCEPPQQEIMDVDERGCQINYCGEF